MFKNLRKPMGIGVVVLALVAGIGAYAFTASNTIADAGSAGIGTAVISGYTITNVTYTLDTADPTKWNAVDFDLGQAATQVQVKFTDSNSVLTTSGWVDCTGVGSTIGTSSPYAVHCVLPDVDSQLDTLTVAAAK
jgi:hypothetical protein